MGVLFFFSHVFITEDVLALLPENERDLYSQYPLWTEIVFAIAVFAGLFGTLGILMLKKWCRPLLVISLVAIIIQMSHSLFIADSVAVYGSMAYLMPSLVVIIAFYEVYLANKAIKNAWIK